MRSAFEQPHTGTNCQRKLWTPHPWRHSSCDWIHGGSPSSLKSPYNPSLDTLSRTCSTLSCPSLVFLLQLILVVYGSFYCSLDQLTWFDSTYADRDVTRTPRISFKRIVTVSTFDHATTWCHMPSAPCKSYRWSGTLTSQPLDICGEDNSGVCYILL